MSRASPVNVQPEIFHTSLEGEGTLCWLRRSRCYIQLFCFAEQDEGPQEASSAVPTSALMGSHKNNVEISKDRRIGSMADRVSGISFDYAGCISLCTTRESFV
jgi:hypothetical protein